MQEFARELISLTVAMSRIYAAEHLSVSRGWFWRTSAALSNLFCCLGSRDHGMSESRGRSSDPSTSKPPRRSLRRSICTVYMLSPKFADLNFQRYDSGNIDQGKAANRLFVPESPSACSQHSADAIARGVITLASVSVVAVGVRGTYPRPRYQVRCQDGRGDRHACGTRIYPSNAANVHGVSRRMGFNFGKCDAQRLGLHVVTLESHDSVSSLSSYRPPSARCV